MTTSTSWRCWPARTAASPACPGNGTRSARPAWPPSNATGCASTAPADRTAARRPTRAENEKAARRGLDEAPRVTLRRQVTTAAASAGSEQEFFARLDQAGVLVRKRFSATNPGQVTGYAVALPGDTAKDGGPVWYGGGKLAADLSWPKLRQRWTPHRATPGRCPVYRRGAERDLGARRPRRRRRRRADPRPGRDRPGRRRRCRLGRLRHPARGRRRARQPHPAPGRRRLRPRRPRPLRPHPAPTPAGNQLRQAARLMSAFAYLTSDRSLAPIVLLTRLAALAEAVAELREAQQHAAQAAAALAPPTAARRRRPGRAPAPAPRPAQARACTAAQLAACRSPAARPAASRPHPDSPARPAARGHHAGLTTTATRPQPLTARRAHLARPSVSGALA